MNRSIRSGLLIIAAILMFFGAAGFTLHIIPDLHGDMIEIGVRPTVLGTTMLHLYFAALAMFAFALLVACAAIHSVRGITPARFPLLIVAIVYVAFGILAFSRSHNPHHLGLLLIGVLIGLALVIPAAEPRH